MSFEQALEESLKSLNSDQKVVGVVLRVTPTEIQVDIGRKQTGYIPYEEFSADPNCNPADCVNVGDELNLIIMKTNDAEGTVMLSKKRYDAQQNWAKVVEALDSKEVLKGTVVEILEKGVIVISDGTRVFIPASQALLSRRDNLADLLNKEVEFRVIDVDKRRRRVVGSINSVAREALKAQKEAFWAQAEVGQKYTGTGKNLTEKVGLTNEIQLDLTLARGLNYYTGAIFEVKALDTPMGSITGGGRYDNLTGIFGMPGLSGVGISFGADRIYDVLNTLELYPEETLNATQVLFINFGEKEAAYCLPIISEVRKKGIRAEIYPDAAKMKKQMGYANAKAIPYVVLVGENEMKEGKVMLKNMVTGEQQLVAPEEMVDMIKA